MLCQRCGKSQATTYVKTIINGKLSEFSLCASCAEEMGYENLLPAINFNSFFKSFAGEEPVESLKCPGCGTTMQEIIKTGCVGCSQCYKVFLDKLLPSIRRIHGTAVHKGKRPGKSAALCAPITKKELTIIDESTEEKKRKLLNQAIEEQRFEDAAVLRDEIKALKNTESGDCHE